MSTTVPRTARTALALALAGVLGTAAPASAESRPAAPRAVAPTLTGASTTLADVTALVGADALHARGTTGRGVDVAVIDTGIAPVHGLSAPGRVVEGPDLSFDSQDPAHAHLDAHGHGTHLAGIIAGPDGVAPGARLVDVRVGAANGAVDVSQVIAAIDWVVQHRQDRGLDIRVLNLAFGTDSRLRAAQDPLAKAVDNAWRHGIVVVAAVGNDGAVDSRVTSPASNPNVLAVGATDSAGSSDPADSLPAAFTARGSTRKPDLLAPGARIVSLRTPGSFLDQVHPEARRGEDGFRGSGTSQATAVVSGAVALLLDQRPELTPDQVKQVLLASAAPVKGSRNAGRAQLDVLQAAGTPVPDRVPALRRMSGTGSIDAARGIARLVRDGVEQGGDQDIFGRPFDSTRWAAASSTASAWDGGSWNGSVWSGSSWNGSSWNGSTWNANSWSGSTWNANSWSGSTWNANSWSGSTWNGSSWSGSTWNGSTWNGSTWNGSTWNGSTWNGSTWNAAVWA